MTPGDGSSGDGVSGEEAPKDDERPKDAEYTVVVRDKRRIDPVTGNVRVPPADEQPAGGGVHVDEAGPDVAATPPDAGLADTGLVDTGLVDTGLVDTGLVDTAGFDALQSQLDERTRDLQRISAEYSNYRRRVERDRQLVIDTAKGQVVSQLLTVLDDIERAAEHSDLSGAFKAVADKVVAALQAQGLVSFGAIGDGFDPEVHEAVQHSTSPEVDKPTVTLVLRLGYRFGERMLRPAMVAVTDAEGDAAPPGDVLDDAEPFGEAGQHTDN